MNNYVLIFCKAMNASDRVLLALKQKQNFQYGKLNLLGGSIETGETLEQAALRELDEEAGLKPLTKPKFLGQIVGDWGVVNCCSVVVPYDLPRPREGEIDIVSWMDWVEVRSSELLIPNLKIIIPLMMTGVSGWKVIDHDASHEFSIFLEKKDE